MERISITKFAALALALLVGCASSETPASPDAGPRYGASPVWPFTVNGVSVGNSPNLAFPGCDAGQALSTIDGGFACTSAGGSGGGGSLDAGPDGDFLQTVSSTPTWVPISQDLTCASGGACTVSQMQNGAAVVATTTGTLTGYDSSPHAYCIGASGNSSNWAAVGLSSSACTSGQVTANDHSLAFDGTHTLLNTPSFGEMLFQSGGVASTNQIGSFSFGSNFQVGATDDFGGGTGIMSINKASANPTCSSFAHGAGFYSDSSTGKMYLCNDGVSSAIDLSNPSPVTWSGDLQGSTSAGPQVVDSAQSGEFTFGNTGTMSLASGATPIWTQASTSGSTGNAMTISPQWSVQGTNETGGNVNINLQAPLGTGTESYFTVQRGGTNQIAIGAFPGGAYSAIWFGANAVSPMANNYGFLGNATTTFLQAATGPLYFRVGGSLVSLINTDGAYEQQSGFNFGIQATGGGSYAGGVGEIYVGNATTVPTGACTGGACLFATGGTLSTNATFAPIAGLAENWATKTTTYTIDSGTFTDFGIFADTTGGAWTVTLPAPTSGRTICFKDSKFNWGTAALSIARHASEKIEGVAATYVAASNGAHICLTSNATDWFFTR
jgi:hypothetical protein